MACKKDFSDYIKIRNMRNDEKHESAVFFDLVVGPYTWYGVRYLTQRGSVQFARGTKTTVKASYVKTLRQIIIAELERFKGQRCPVEFRFEKKKVHESKDLYLEND